MSFCPEGKQNWPKPRLVARIFSQMHTVDILETYAPTSTASSVKRLVTTGVENDWEIRQLDVKRASIQADLDFNVSMKLPEVAETREVE